MWTIIHIIDLALWIFIAPSVIYVLFYAIVSLFHHKKNKTTITEVQHTYLVLFPAYHEDAVIVSSIKSFLEQTYPKTHYDVAVISDHMTKSTNDALLALPITLHRPIFYKSSKAKALQYAISETRKQYDHVVILDADNVVHADFLERLNAVCCQGFDFIQCHRCAKNSDNDIAALEGTSEEINNTIFRKAHNIIGMSSALIGSGMCFRFEWFKNHVSKLQTAVEDRELEAMLMQENIFIKYEATIHVYDEKVSNQDNFRRQRLRWMTGQIQSLLFMLPYLPKALIKGNINYIDKTLQQLLIPRSILLATIPVASVIMTCVYWQWGLRWWALFIALIIALLIAIPRHLRTRAIFGKIISFIKLTGSMLQNLTKINIKSNDFIHTSHHK